jgi:hypothetical protein
MCWHRRALRLHLRTGGRGDRDGNPGARSLSIRTRQLGHEFSEEDLLPDCLKSFLQAEAA